MTQRAEATNSRTVTGGATRVAGPFDRRRFLAALTAAPVLAALMQACGDDAPDKVATGRQRSDVARSKPDPAGAAAAAAAVNLFGTELYRRFAAADPVGNLTLSPTSIALALSMAAAGARGATLAEMLSVLAIDEAALHPQMNSLDSALAARNRDDVQVSIANSAWLQEAMTVQQPFLDLLATQYGSGVELVDYEADADGARVAINAWVADQTNERIPELLAPGVLDELTRFVLVNAIYLKAMWAMPFNPASTVDAPFTTAAGDIVDVSMMTIESELPYASGDGWQAVELSYVGEEVAMLLFLLEPEFLSTFEEIFLVTDATQYLAPRRAIVRLPRWDTSSRLELADQLIAMGLTTAFSDDADFTGITTEIGLRLAKVVHQANITVGEDGTEAAAATAVIGTATAAPPAEEPVTLVFDHPFVFALRDRTSGAVLFLGRVADPTA